MLTANKLNFWFFLTWCWVCSTIILLGTVAMEWRRNIQPVKARDRILSFLTNFAYLSFIMLRSVITFRPDLSCLLEIWQAQISIGFLTSIFLLRSWWMYFKFELAHERSLIRSLDVKNQASEDPGHRKSFSLTPSAVTAARPGQRITWFSDHRYLISDKFTVVLVSISVVIFFIPNVFLSLQGNFINLEAGSENCKLSPFMIFWQTGWGFILQVGLLIFAIKLRKTFDAFGIKQELKAVFFLNVASWTITTGLALWQTDFNTAVFNIRRLAPMVFNMFLFIQTTVIPVYRTFDAQGQNAVAGTGTNNDINTLTGLLKSPEGFAAFQQYLIGCFCVESCLFWRDIEDYRAQVLSSLRHATQQKVKYLSDLRVLLERAKEINMIYIKEDSRLQVNISSSQRQRVENAVNNLFVKYESQTVEVTATPTELVIPVDEGAARTSLIGLLQPTSIRSAPDRNHAVTPIQENAADDRSKTADDGNINPDLKEQFKDILNVFNIAQLEVIELMRTDPYPRFRLTKQFQDILQQSELKQHRIDALRDLNVI